MTIYHKHHIIPKHAGGSDHPDNIVLLSVTEHAEAHKVLYEKYGRWQDFVAWKGLLKQINLQEITRLKLSEAGKKGAQKSAKPWWTNGIDTKRSNECPGDGWYKGRSCNLNRIKSNFVWRCEECGKEDIKRSTSNNKKLKYCSHKCSSINLYKNNKIRPYGSKKREP